MSYESVSSIKFYLYKATCVIYSRLISHGLIVLLFANVQFRTALMHAISPQARNKMESANQKCFVCSSTRNTVVLDTCVQYTLSLSPKYRPSAYRSSWCSFRKHQFQGVRMKLVLKSCCSIRPTWTVLALLSCLTCREHGVRETTINGGIDRDL